MSNKSNFIPELPCETLVRNVCGDSWRNFDKEEIDGPWGIAIVKAILDGCKADLSEISKYLGVEKHTIQKAFKRLSLNGAFLRKAHKIHIDTEALADENNVVAWSYYAGYASGATGIGS